MNDHECKQITERYGGNQLETTTNDERTKLCYVQCEKAEDNTPEGTVVAVESHL